MSEKSCNDIQQRVEAAFHLLAAVEACYEGKKLPAPLRRAHETIVGELRAQAERCRGKLCASRCHEALTTMHQKQASSYPTQAA